MAHNYGAKITTLDFSNMAGGINTTDPATDIRDNQVQYALNAIFSNKGFGRCNGLVGLKNSIIFSSSRGYGLHVYEKSDGGEELLCVAGSKLYKINTSTGAETQLYDFGSSGEAYFTNYLGICFVCNGSKLIKYDGTNAYQCGIAAPTAGNAAAISGGSLSAGVYQIYIGYARKVSGSNVLYGSGYSLGSVTLSGANLSIEISNFSNSSDPQVTNKIVWMTDADGATFYYYYESNNILTTFQITSDSTKDSTRQYDVLAAYNFVPVNPQYVFVYDNRLWYTSSDSAYFSLQAGTIYDLEKFDTGADGNVLKFPYQISGGFAIGQYLCFNSTNGIIIIPNGDISQRYDIRGYPYYFKYFRTVDIWNNLAIGLTNDGIRIFDGVSFSNVNISRDIKVEINRCYTSTNDIFIPCGKVIRNADNDRTEYVLSFLDSNVSGYCNNRTWVLDLDSLNIDSPDNYNTQWEQWQNGFSYITNFKNGTIYCMQSKPSESNIIKFSNDSTADKWIFNENGVWVSDSTNRKLQIKTKERIPDLLGYCRWMYLHMYGLATSDLTFKVSIGDDYTRNNTKTFVHASAAQPLYDVDLFDVAVFGENTAVKNRKALHKAMKGNSVFIEIEQTADDTELVFNRVFLTGTIKRTRRT